MSTSVGSFLPPAPLGILGGGQLGRYFAQAAQDLGYQVYVLDPDPLSPAGQVAQHHIPLDYLDREGLECLAKNCVAVSTEFENVPAKALDFLNYKGLFVAPGSETVSIAQHRIKEKRFFSTQETAFGILPAPFAVIESLEHCENVSPALFPGILKTAQMGYDGKGQQTVHNSAELQEAWKRLAKVPCVLEKRLDLAFEVSAIVARSFDDEVEIFPLTENQHRNGILHLSFSPAPSLNDETAKQIQEAAIAFVRALHYVGVLCIEFFVLKDGTVVVNEIAPRPHNSGHHTLDSCTVSQFEQQVRALAKMPLGKPRLISPVVMLNLLGDIWSKGEPAWEKILAIPDAHLHLYGKAEAKPGRKMGHINFLADSMEEALEDAYAAMKILHIPI